MTDHTHDLATTITELETANDFQSCAMRAHKHWPQLLSAARIAQELTALLGADPVGRVKELLRVALEIRCGLQLDDDERSRLISAAGMDDERQGSGTIVHDIELTIKAWKGWCQGARKERDEARAALAEKETDLQRALALIGQLRAGEMKLQLEENARLRERVAEKERER